MPSKPPSARTALTSLFVFLLLAGCGGEPTTPSVAPTFTPVFTSTPDVCAPENIPSQVAPIHALMRAFDDTSQVALLADVSQMVFLIPPLQEIRRQAEDMQVPDCVAILHDLEILYMNSVITTLLVFMQVGASDPQVLMEGIAQGRSLHDLYFQELIRLVGATPVPTDMPLPTLTATTTP